MAQRIAESPESILMPQIDSLDPETFRVYGGGIGCNLGFRWSFSEWAQPDTPLTSPDPRPTATMAGGLMAVDRKFFWEIGG